MQHSEKFIKINEDNLFINYTDDGPLDAEVLIFIHGFPLNKEMWANQVHEFKDQYRIITYDVRGHGKSESGIEEFSIAQFANDLNGLMTALSINKATICGFSMGGFIAQYAAKEFPERFEGLILANTNCIADTDKTKENRRKAMDSIVELGVGNFAIESVKKMFSSESFSNRKEEIAQVKDMILTTPVPSLLSSLKAMAARESQCATLVALHIPILIIVGEEDQITPIPMAKQMQESNKDAQMNIIGHSGHMSNMENPYEFNKKLKSFLTSVYKKVRTRKAVPI